MNEAITGALETPEFDRTPEQDAIAALHAAAERAIWEIEAGYMTHQQGRKSLVSFLKNVTSTDN